MIGLIVGSGMHDLYIDEAQDRVIETPYGEVEVVVGQWQGKAIVLLHRHGKDHRYAPHQIPAKAQIGL